MRVSPSDPVAAIVRNALFCLTIVPMVELVAVAVDPPAATGTFTEFSLPNPGSGPTTISIAPDGTLWFTESAGNRIGRMAPDGSNLKEFALPNPNSSPRIIALGSDGNMWFSEHTGNRIGRITPEGTISEFPIPTPDSMPRAIALGSDGNIWFGEFGGGKIGRITPAGA